MGFSFLYITTNNADEAERIGDALVKERLAASVNIIERLTSIYRWEDEIHRKQEALLVAKTTTYCVEKAIERIRTLHTYQCPCIASWNIDGGNDAYFDWIEQETTS